MSSPMKSNILQRGVTLLEVLIFITILSFVFIGVAITTTSSLQRTQYNQHKILATHYAEELEEWMRGEKEADWTSFVNKSAALPGRIYCFNSTTIAWPSVGNCSGVYGLVNTFKREATLSGTGSQITVNINIEWQEASNLFSIPIDTVFSQWD
ncbi:hypothetical protein A3H80_03730 [Candidatus Roizmanbacteria bacterium RIFCSPLOWO2_02_FULL_37_19]|uniref:Type II secretion system protein GspI C-terminal domain-containing protein n=1 Tax=Candidatus Roizmanbacteria bacterium RIFCSPHIGHO2_02_FULL_37_24 TaxID=1802037 RepID=A0A1F7GV59_9BACT|nr:MAG: hypothetical protein A2862_01820 [Candidatus Roizmanbacteria bacterium RIFCSPHIGHO2_01_FULL_38_41]OGK22920.1 MAG: hypothetical protein A3C24_03610 [Candidatus Roizmanbacteria bacterium RIFCSPHIGHO2_02_FULL_37_24]OGK33626.1 MAG: hypothetical protein A3E10_05175 [Candidatus Roizmanbacteria bacterium RIFCSPHIGHO2_12_FULL_37_23]OGK55278.1 MAG: hypothetical protein A3H80_03730 [Candidatus Roizmanbacteria bacterium RIFCSPLOWO2_02_FULL_37_19]